MENGSADNAVWCANCGHPNPPSLIICRDCGAALWTWCPACDHRNQRTLSHCAQCGHSLRSSVWERWRLRFARVPKAAPLLIIVILAAIIVVIVAGWYKFLWKFLRG